MTYQQLIAFFGSTSVLGNALDISRQAVHKWETMGIPEARRDQIEIATNGAIKASELPALKTGPKPPKKTPFEKLQESKCES